MLVNLRWRDGADVDNEARVSLLQRLFECVGEPPGARRSDIPRRGRLHDAAAGFLVEVDAHRLQSFDYDVFTVMHAWISCVKRNPGRFEHAADGCWVTGPHQPLE